MVDGEDKAELAIDRQREVYTALVSNIRRPRMYRIMGLSCAGVVGVLATIYPFIPPGAPEYALVIMFLLFACASVGFLWLGSVISKRANKVSSRRPITLFKYFMVFLLFLAFIVAWFIV